MKSIEQYLPNIFPSQSEHRIQAQDIAVTLVNRRALLKLTGISIASSLILASCESKSPQENHQSPTPVEGGSDPSVAEPHQLNIFVTINADNSVSLIAQRSEMGQGIRTSIMQILADELDVTWDSIDVEQAPGDAKFGDQNTDGSQSIRKLMPLLLKMAASARTMLTHAAAEAWQVNIGEIRTKDNYLLHEPTGKKSSYSEMAERASKIQLEDSLPLRYKTKAEYQYIGKPMSGVDNEAMVSGQATFGFDVQLPGMLYASVERCPVVGGELKAFNKESILKEKGVVDTFTFAKNTFPLYFAPLHGVAIIAKDSWSALQAREKLQCQWEKGINGQHDSDNFRQELVDRVKTPGDVVNVRGEKDVDALLNDKNHTIIDAVYTVPYIPHAPMEPPAALAHVQEGRCELWICTQSPQRIRQEVANALKFPLENVTVNVTLLGGAFGRKSKADFAIEAALLSRHVGKPVKLFWTREDDIQFGYYHAISAQYYKAAIDKQGDVVAWLQRSAFPSIMSLFADKHDDYPAGWELDLGFNDMPVDVPNIRHEKHKAKARVRIGWVRSVANIHHAFARASFIDELAAYQKVPPVEFLTKLIGSEDEIDVRKMGWKYGNYDADLFRYPLSAKRLKGVLHRVAASSKLDVLPEGQGWGVAVHRSFLSYVAVATRVTVKDKNLTVNEVHIVIDCGQVINPDRVRSQMEGSVIFGLSLAASGKVDIREGAVVQGNFDDYPLARMSQTPDHIVVEIVDSDAPHSGVGEPGVPPVAPSLTNAIFAATGTRIRDLPVNQYFNV